jgi:hypothetical protein
MLPTSKGARVHGGHDPDPRRGHGLPYHTENPHAPPRGHSGLDGCTSGLAPTFWPVATGTRKRQDRDGADQSEFCSSAYFAAVLGGDDPAGMAGGALTRARKT